MSAPDERYVCDLRRVMRARLLCGLYSRRAVPPRWRRLAQAYCLTLTAAIAFMTYFITTKWITNMLGTITYYSAFAQFFGAQVVSLWGGDEYIYIFFTCNRMADVTQDSSLVFNSLQKQLTQGLIYISVFVFSFAGLFCWTIFNHFNLKTTIAITFGTTMLELLDAYSYSGKFLVLSLFNARMLVLKRKWQRYGYRVVGRMPPQPYCQIYGEIWEMLDATDNPLKLLLLFDMTFSGIKLTGWFLAVLLGFRRSVRKNALSYVMYLAVNTPNLVLFTFGHIMQLESAATHCKEMEIFTATQLIKTPTASERKRMREFLRVLEHRGARYSVLRLPLDARLVLRALGFITAQALVFADTVLTD